MLTRTMPASPASTRALTGRLSGLEGLALACFFLSGFAGLVYQVSWIRMSSLVFGSATQAVATVLGVFFLGWALGSWLIGSFAARTPRPLRAYAVLEIALGVVAALSPLLFALADAVYGSLYNTLLADPTALAFARAGLIVLLLLPPATVMGGTLPLYVAHFTRRADRVGRSIGALYALNTAGAVLGCLLAGFVLIPGIGTRWSIFAMAALNISIGLVLLRAPAAPAPATNAAGSTPARREQAETTGEPPQPKGPAYAPMVIGALFALSGLAFLAYEVMWTRYLALLIRNSVHTYTITLCVILAGIVVGSLLAAALSDRGPLSRRRPLAWGLAQAATGLSVLAVLMLPPSTWGDVFTAAGLVERVAIVMGVMFIPAVLAGVGYPLAIRMVVERPELAALGVGRMTALNTLGSIAGSVLCGFVLLPQLGLHTTALVITALSLVLALACWWLLSRGTLALRGALTLAAVGLWLGIPALSGVRLPRDYLLGPTDAPEALVAYREGLTANMAVLQRGTVLQLEIDRLWQGEDRRNHQIMAAHVPMIVHGGDPKRVAVIGLGTGMTASRFLFYPIERLVCVDIEPGLFELVREHFPSVGVPDGGTNVATWLDDPRVVSIAEDGRSHLAHTDETFDVISVEVGQSFRPGVAAFYSVEFYELCRERLTPGGLVCQFVPVGYFTPDELRRVIASFVSAFPASVLWYNATELLLIGRAGEAFPLPAKGPARLADVGSVQRDLAYSQWGGERVHLSQPGAFLGGLLVGPSGLAAIAANTTLYHDDPPAFEYSASAPRPVISGGLESANLALLRPHLADVGTLVDAPLDPQVQAEAARVQDRNLADILAWPIGQTAMSLYTEGKLREAAAAFQAALSRNPDNLIARRVLGDVLAGLGQHPASAAAYQQALTQSPGDVRLLGSLSRSLTLQGKFAEAVPPLEQAVLAKPGDADLRRSLARAMNLAGRAREAVPHWVAGLPEAGSGTPDDWYERGLAHQAAEDVESAISAYQTAVSRNPQLAKAHVNLGIVLTRLGRRDEAVEAYRAGLRADPNLLEANYNLGTALLAAAQGQDTERLSESVRLLTRAAQLKPDLWQAQWQLGLALERLAQLEPAAGALRQASDLRPPGPRVAADLGRVLVKLRRADEARDAFQRALAMDAAFAPARAGMQMLDAIRSGSQFTIEEIDQRLR